MVKHLIFILLTNPASMLASVILVIVTMSDINMHCGIYYISHKNRNTQTGVHILTTLQLF